MKQSIYDKVIQALKQAEQHNSNIMVKPEVILWPDPENQWAEVIPVLQSEFPQLLIFGEYNPSKKQGPAIWIKCMVAKTLPDAKWEDDVTPIIYLPGIAKTDLRNVEEAGLQFQPLLEYQYTGILFLQENGREWTILAFVENPLNGLGLKILKDTATKDALKKVLPTIFQDNDVLHSATIIDAAYLNNHLFPDITSGILNWMCKGDIFLQKMDKGKREVFSTLSESQYEFKPEHKNIKAIAEKLGSQRNNWKYVWQMYANAPRKFREIEELLRLAKPGDLGSGIFAFPEESWPQVNESMEEELYQALMKTSKIHAKDALEALKNLEQKHQVRRNWIWYELDYAPLANALQYLIKMVEITSTPFPSNTIGDLKEYYISKGYLADQAMRKSLAAVKTENHKSVIKALIKSIYQPWLDLITQKFQNLVAEDASIFTGQAAQIEKESYVLFVDAFRYELAKEFTERLIKSKYKVELETNWSAIPTVTPTAKPANSPMATSISVKSEISDFRPQLQSGKDLQVAVFRESLAENNFKSVVNSNEIDTEINCWQEIGEIDTKGHNEQSAMVKRIDELFDQVLEVIETAFEKGIKRIKIVTDHGWLLLPGGLPKTQINVDLTQTRWGRCALIKEGTKTDLLQLPWRWNPMIFIAYAPGISFFKINEEFAHGGISLHECLIPTLLVENPSGSQIAAKILQVKWVNLKCAVETENAKDGFTLDIRTKYSDEKTSIVESRKREVVNNKGSVMVNDEAESQAATIVLLDENGTILDKKLTTVGG